MDVSREKALELSVRAGEILLQNGGEISRVQETMIRILEAYGVQNHNVYVISNGIFASVEEGDAHAFQALRHIPARDVNLARIAAINELSREIAAGKTRDEKQVASRLREIAAMPLLPFWLQVLACAAGAACFCYILGGQPWDSVAAFIAGFHLKLFLRGSEKLKLNKFLPILLGSAFVTLCSQVLFALGVGATLDRVIIGAIIPLVPGVVLTTAFRNYFNSDYLSGTILLVEALFMAVSIAVGVGFMLGLWGLVAGVMA